MRWRIRACNLAMHIGGHSAKSDHKQTTQLDSRCAFASIARVFGVCQQRLMCGQRGCRRLPNRLVAPCHNLKRFVAFQGRTTVLIQMRKEKCKEMGSSVTVPCRPCHLVEEWRTMHCALVHGISCLSACLIACLSERLIGGSNKKK